MSPMLRSCGLYSSPADSRIITTIGVRCCSARGAMKSSCEHFILQRRELVMECWSAPTTVEGTLGFIWSHT